MWVFGYGSLIWKADFPYERKLVGCIKGYVRRFYQKSTDHRGVPSRPGRVVTLLSSDNPEDEVWGLAYKISDEDIDRVVNHLDFREKGGYERKSVLFYPCDPSKNGNMKTFNISTSANGLVERNLMKSTMPPSVEEDPFYLTIYIGGEDNPNYAGIEDINTIARHIVKAHGPSGPNTEYLYNLASAMRMIAPDIYDEHLFTLEAAVKILEEENKKGLEKSIPKACSCSDKS